MKSVNQKSVIVILILSIFLNPVASLANECGIKYCSSCDPANNFCFECDLPYKPGYSNQTVCTRCANNCAICQQQGNDSKGQCISCQSNFDYSSDNRCDTFFIWIYVVVIGSYAAFVLTLVIIFSLINKRKQRKKLSWFQHLKRKYNKVNQDKVTELQFEKMCQSLLQLLKQSSSYNNLKFKDREHQKAMKIKSIKLKPVKDQTYIRSLVIKGVDNSEWQGSGYVLMPEGQNCDLKVWFVKNYVRRVYSEQMSKIIIYESNYVTNNEIRGKWFYYDRPQIKGEWKGLRYKANAHHVDQRSQN